MRDFCLSVRDWGRRASRQRLSGDSPHELSIQIEATNSPDHISVNFQGMIVLEEGTGVRVLHDEHPLLLAHPSCMHVSTNLI